MTRNARSLITGAVLAISATSACIEPSNPCDPSADPALQAEGTRISGVVRDTDDTPLGGVPIAITGRADTVVSASDGTFAFTSLPPAPSYELVALPQAPAVGGRARTAELACRAQIEDVKLVVVVPPASPEVEIVKASGDNRLLVAFGGIEPVDEGETSGMYEMKEDESSAGLYREPDDVTADCNSGLEDGTVSFRVQVRSPFGAWQDAVLTPFPWSASPAADDPSTEDVDERAAATSLADSAVYTARIDDRCSAALCTQFVHVDESLTSPLARCAEVVGMIEDDVIEPLVPYASYHVRVLSEKRTPEPLRTSALLPERVEGAAAASTGQMTLVPGALMPVANGDGSEHDARDDDVLAVVPTAGGRFAVVAADGVMVVGDGSDTMSADARESYDGVQNAAAADGTTSQMATDAMMEGASEVRPMSVLAAGQWARVMRGGDGLPRIKKLYLGVDTEDGNGGADPTEREKNRLEPELLFDVESPSLGAPRALGYLMRPAGSIAQDTMSPDDAYVLVYPHSLVLVEERRPNLDAGGDALEQMALAHFTTAGPAHAALGAFTGTWADRADTDRVERVGLDGQMAAFGGGCALLRDELDSDGDGVGNTTDTDADGDGVVDGQQTDFSPLPTQYGDVELIVGDDLISRRTAVCFDVEGALDEPVDLVDIEVLDDASGVIEDAVHLITDARNDRVLAVRARDLACTDCTGTEAPLARRLLDDAVNVGREPTGMSRSRLLRACPPVDGLEPTPVMLVANRRGGDVSVLTASGGVVEETAIVPMPADIVGFLDDADGPTCADPFAWALGEDGRVFPIDMRDTPSVPLCDERPCEVNTRGRAVTGAIGRRPAGPMRDRARAVLGGPGLVGELGFSKPKALAGEAFTEPDQFPDDGQGEPVDP